MAYTDIQKRIRKRKIRFRIFLSILLISIAAVFLLKTPVLKVNNIIVKGNSVVAPETLIGLSDIKNGDNLLRLNIKKINANIKTNSYIETSKIRRTINGIVYIMVTERQTAGVANYNSKYVTIDKKGVIIEVLEKKEGVNLPLIQGLDIKNAVPGRTAELTDPRKIDALQKIFDNISSSGLSDIISEVDIKSLFSIIIKTKHSINFKIGDTDDIGTKLEYCKTIMEKDLLEKGSKGTIDVSFKGNPVFIPEK
jgi:Cell division septal protein